jgi:hypothetical protein
MRWDRPEPAVASLVLHRGAHGDPTVEAQLIGNGDLRLLSIQRSGVWMYSEIDTIGWWTWHTVSHADLPRLAGAGADVLEAVRAAVAPVAEDETDDLERVSGIVRRFVAWLDERGVPYTRDAYDEREP